MNREMQLLAAQKIARNMGALVNKGAGLAAVIRILSANGCKTIRELEAKVANSQPAN